MKVDQARRRGGIHVVWVSWLVDSLAHWKRQDETPYIIDADAPAAESTTPPPPEISLEGEIEEPVEELITDDPNMWADASAEVDAFLDETDDEDGAGEEDGGWRTDGR